jgi:CCR4-NOT transcription complex subunit 7/8
MRCNVDLLKIIQLGITLADEEGQFPQECSTWQFNFRFSLAEDMYPPDSIEQLQKAGIEFQKHEEYGILPNDFAELMITSGLVLAPETKWISFHSGYDFGYFVKLLTAESLPMTEDGFFALLNIWFPTVYDIKYLMKASKLLKGGLQEVADDLGVLRMVATQQAGSDSLLTSSTFFKMREIYFNDQIDDAEYSGKLYGLGQTFAVSNGLTDPTRGGATTIAERDDRGSAARDVHNQTPGPNNGNNNNNNNTATAQQQTQNVNMALGSMQAGIPSAMTPGPYGPMSNGPPGYMRTMVGGGGR